MTEQGILLHSILSVTISKDDSESNLEFIIFSLCFAGSHLKQ